MERKSKEERIAIINAIIREIADRGRKFFRHGDNVAELFLRNNKVRYRCEYVPYDHSPKEICLSIPEYQMPKGWYHGGTLRALVLDFRDFIQRGGFTNHNHGYGGLYCPHWGYSAEDMQAIQQKAIDLGYLHHPGTTNPI